MSNSSLSPSVSDEEREFFDALLERILESLPDDVHQLLDSVALIVEDEPPAEMLRELGIPLGSDGLADLCGLHWGVPLSERTVLEAQPYPEQVFVFRGPILRLVADEAPHIEGNALANQIRITLLHELGHHFGMDEDRLKDLGYD